MSDLVGFYFECVFGSFLNHVEKAVMKLRVLACLLALEGKHWPGIVGALYEGTTCSGDRAS